MSADHGAAPKHRPFWTQNPRPVVVATRRNVHRLFDVSAPIPCDFGPYRTFVCRRCGHSGTCRSHDVPLPHVCEADVDTGACTCSMTRLVEGARRFFIDGNDETCPVHGAPLEKSPYTPKKKRGR